MSDQSMQTPEEVARAIEECEQRPGGRCYTHNAPWPCNDSAVQWVTGHIRERDVEVTVHVLREVADLVEKYLGYEGEIDAPGEPRMIMAYDWLRERADRIERQGPSA